jgi:2C-methyl-D-erythritol 2,4-cyclodiphosphate synthase
MGTRTNDLIPNIVKAIQEQNYTINQLQSTVDLQNQKIQSLQEQMNNMMARLYAAGI